MGEAIKTNSSNSGLILLFSLAWAAILLTGFLYFRGDDLGKLSLLLGNLSLAKLFGIDGFIDSIFGTFSAALIFLAWFGLGKFIKNAVEHWFSAGEELDTSPSCLDFAISLTLGAGMWSFIWFFVGILDLYQKMSAIVLLLIGLILAGVSLFRTWKTDKVENEQSTILGKLIFALILALGFLTFISAIAPPTAKDTLLYHFSVPEHFIAVGNNGVIEGNIASYLALGTEMHVVWAMLTGGLYSARAGEVAAGAIVFAFLPILLLFVYGWSRELGISKSLSLISVLLISSIPTVYYVASSGYIDIALALFITLGIYCVGKWWKNPESKWLVYTAVFLGSALAVKLTAAFALVAIALVVLWRIRKAQNEESPNVAKLAKSACLMFVGIGALASPWYFRDLAATGSPVFPFYTNLLNASAIGWDDERSTLFQIINSQYGGVEKGFVDYLLSPLTLSIKAQPEFPAFYDGVLGVAFIFGLPLIIWCWLKMDLKTELKLALSVSAMLFMFWLFTSQQLRYLLPIFPVLAVSTCFAANSMSTKLSFAKNGFAVILLGISLASGGVTLAWFVKKNPINVAFGGETRDEFLTRNLDYYPYYQIINSETSREAKVWLINMRRDTYNLEKPYFSDYMFEDWTLKRLVDSVDSLPDLRAKIKDMGITHLLVRHDFLLDYRRSVFVDDKRTETENLEKLNMAKALILDEQNTLKADNRFSLIKLP